MQSKERRFSVNELPMKAVLYVLFAVGFCVSPCFSQTFTDQTAALTGGLAGWMVAWGDYNDDGYVDFLTGNRVYRNNGPDEDGNWSFTSVFGLVTGLGLDGIWADYDNDGDLDIYSWSRQQILRYDGGTTFTQVGMPTVTGSYGACWADYDNDGWLDLFVVGGGGTNRGNAMLKNNTDGTFTKAWTVCCNNSRGVTSTDFDRDGDQDIYISNYWQGNNFMRNPGAIGTTEWADSGFGLGEIPVGYTGGSAFGDFDNDGNMDAATGNLDHGPQHSSSVYRNLGPAGDYHFTEEFAFTGADHQEGYNSPSLGDYDNDGDLDVLMTVWQNYGNAARLYRNDGNWKFTNVTAAEGLPTNMGRSNNDGAAWADFDNDGDLDLIAGEKVFVNSGNSNHWLKVHLAGDGKSVNSTAIGTTVRIAVGNLTITRQVEGGTGVGNQNDPTLHFGLGSHNEPVDLEIVAPGGATWTIPGVEVDQAVTCGVPKAEN